MLGKMSQICSSKPYYRNHLTHKQDTSCSTEQLIISLQAVNKQITFWEYGTGLYCKIAQAVSAALFHNGKHSPFFYHWYTSDLIVIIHTSKKQDSHTLFISASWQHMNCYVINTSTCCNAFASPPGILIFYLQKVENM